MSQSKENPKQPKKVIPFTRQTMKESSQNMTTIPQKFQERSMHQIFSNLQMKKYQQYNKNLATHPTERNTISPDTTAPEFI